MGKLKRYGTYQSVEYTDLKELLNTAASKYGNSVAFREMDKYRKQNTAPFSPLIRDERLILPL